MNTDIVVIIILVIGLIVLVRLLTKNNHAKDYAATNASRKPKKASNISNPPAPSASAKDAIEPPDDFLVFTLLNNHQNSKSREFLDNLDTLRRPHPMLMHLSRNIVEPKELFDVIRTDPELVAKVITLVNSPVYAVRKPITNINHAVIFLGVLQVKNIATQFALERSVAFSSKQQEKAYQLIWNASFLASTIGLLLAKELNFENSAELSTRCLLSYLGDITVLSAKPELAHLYIDEQSLFNRVKYMQAKLTTNTALVGQAIALKWALPETISNNLHLSLLPLVDDAGLKQLDEQAFKELVLCFYACRLADLLIFDGPKTFNQMQSCDYQSSAKIEFYYAQKQLELAGLESINRVVNGVAFKRKVTDMLASLTKD